MHDFGCVPPHAPQNPEPHETTKTQTCCQASEASTLTPDILPPRYNPGALYTECITATNLTKNEKTSPKTNKPQGDTHPVPHNHNHDHVQNF